MAITRCGPNMDSKLRRSASLPTGHFTLTSKRSASMPAMRACLRVTITRLAKRAGSSDSPRSTIAGSGVATSR